MTAYKLQQVGVLNLDTGETVTPQPLGNAAWSAYIAWFLAGGAPLPADPVPAAVPVSAAAEAAAQAEIAERSAIVAALKINPLVQGLVTRAPADVDSWISTQVVDLTSAKVVLRVLAYVVALLARERLQ